MAKAKNLNDPGILKVETRDHFTPKNPYARLDFIKVPTSLSQTAEIDMSMHDIVRLCGFIGLK